MIGVHSDPCQLLIDPGTRDCGNLGDVAMLQVALARLTALWPRATANVLTADEAALARHCPRAVPVPHGVREQFLDNRILAGPIYGRLPSAGRAWVRRSHRTVRARWPEMHAGALALHHRLRHAPVGPLRAFAATLDATDLLVFCGQGTIADAGGRHAHVMLDTAAAALARGVPVVMMGQGIGPLTDRELVAHARAVLPHVSLLALRERRCGPALAAELGVPADRVVVTGDDAVELAYGAPRPLWPTGLGVHLRAAPEAITDEAVFAAARGAVLAAARRFEAQLVPLPISHHAVGANDARTLRRLLAGAAELAIDPVALDTPERLIRAAGRCRVVVTGAYHAAVFALSQGVPTICLGRSTYYLTKFQGLADLFGAGCRVLDLTDPMLGRTLGAAIEWGWAEAQAAAPRLLEAARRQIELGHAAYARLAGILERGGAPAVPLRSVP